MKKRVPDIFIIPILLGLFTAVMICTSPITFTEGLAFLLYQIFGIFLPGVLLCYWLAIPCLSSCERGMMGFGLGYVMAIIQYFIFALLDALPYLRYFQIAIAIFVMGYLVYKRHYRKILCEAGEPVDKGCLIMALFCIIVFAVRYVTYYGLNMLPGEEAGGVTFQTQDILFYIGNAISAKKGFPIQEYRFLGETFKYHYFGSIQLAVGSVVTGIDALRLETCLMWIQALLLYVSAFDLLLRSFGLKEKKRALAFFLLLFTAGRELIVYVSYQHIMYQTPFGFDIGIAMGFFFVALLYTQYKSNQFQKGVWIAALLFFFACEGAKAPIAVIMLLLAGMVCGIWLLQKDRRKWAFGYGIPLVAVFVVVFFAFVSNGFDTITVNSSGLKFDPTGHIYECGLGKLYFQWVDKGMPGLLGKVLVFIMFFFGCNMCVYFLCALFGIRKIRRGGLFSFEGALLLTALAGMGFTLMTKQQGNSQMYFAMTSFPLAILFDIKELDGYGFDRKGILQKTGAGCFVLLLIWSFISFIEIVGPTFCSGVHNLSGDNTFSNVNNSLSFEEQKAFEWVRDNTPEDAVCVVNTILSDEQYESFITGVCTERQMYMEGWRYVAGYISQEEIECRRETIAGFYANDLTAIRQVKEEGVDYAIWVKRYAGREDDARNFIFGQLLFENDSVKVYRINENGDR
ncbi:MAG: hypothetical protein ACI4AB_05965 [Acetatifactor sp.]